MPSHQLCFFYSQIFRGNDKIPTVSLNSAIKSNPNIVESQKSFELDRVRGNCRLLDNPEDEVPMPKRKTFFYVHNRIVIVIC